MRTMRIEWLLLVAVMGVVGCGGSELPRNPVQGYVFFEGQPVDSGIIRFLPTESTKGPAATATINDGFYKIERDSGPVAGTYRVEIEKQLATEFEIDDEAAYAEAFKRTKGKPLPQQAIPAKFNRQSTLKATVEPVADVVTLDYDLRLTSN